MSDQKYYDGKVQFTRRRMANRAEVHANGGNDYLADWYCPGCGTHHQARWSGGGPNPDPVSGIALGCQCGLWFEDEYTFVLVKEISAEAKRPLKKIPLRGPTPPRKIVRDGVECYVCECCGIAGNDLASGDRVEVRYASGGFVGEGVAVSFHTQSQGHQVWTILFDDKSKSDFGRGCLTKIATAQPRA